MALTVATGALDVDKNQVEPANAKDQVQILRERLRMDGVLDKLRVDPDDSSTVKVDAYVPPEDGREEEGPHRRRPRQP